jgi:hypothetical protein
VAIARIEQLAPFPFDLILSTLKDYAQAEVVWCQEVSSLCCLYTLKQLVSEEFNSLSKLFYLINFCLIN